MPIERTPVNSGYHMNIKDRINVTKEYGLIFHNVVGTLLKVQRPGFATRRIFGNEEPTTEDRELVSTFMYDNKGIRLVVGMANLLAGHLDHKVSSSEKIGIVYLCNAVINCDTNIDTSPEFQGLSTNELRSKLFSKPVRTIRGELVAKPEDLDVVPLTIGGLIEMAKSHVDEEKRHIVDDLFNGLLETHNNLSRVKLGEYNYEDVIAYRERTNSACIAALANLMGVENQDIVRQYQNVIHVVQHFDDLADWADDANEGNYNLFLGLANNLAADFPQEYANIVNYIENQQASEQPSKVTENWYIENTSHIYGEYISSKFLSLINSFTDRELRVFSWFIKKTSQRILRRVN